MAKKVKLQMLVEHQDGSEEFLMQCYTRDQECAVLLSVPNTKFIKSMFEGMQPAIVESFRKALEEVTEAKQPGDLNVVPFGGVKH